MKRTQLPKSHILQALCVLSFALYALIFASAFAQLPLSIPTWHQHLLLFSHCIPMFFAELCLCQAGKRRWRLPAALLPLVLVGIWFLSTADWHSMAWIFFLCWCIPPLLGCFAAWGVWALFTRVQK